MSAVALGTRLVDASLWRAHEHRLAAGSRTAAKLIRRGVARANAGAIASAVPQRSSPPTSRHGAGRSSLSIHAPRTKREGAVALEHLPNPAIRGSAVVAGWQVHRASSAASPTLPFQ